jgi:hypothetical protein
LTATKATLKIEAKKEGQTVNFTGVKVFSATKAREREELGEHVTQWIRNNPNNKIIDKIVTQSSDREFHCLTITIFYEKDSTQAAA